MSILTKQSSNHVRSSLLVFPITPVFQEKPSLVRYVFRALLFVSTFKTFLSEIRSYALCEETHWNDSFFLIWSPENFRYLNGACPFSIRAKSRSSPCNKEKTAGTQCGSITHTVWQHHVPSPEQVCCPQTPRDTRERRGRKPQAIFTKRHRKSRCFYFQGRHHGTWQGWRIKQRTG